MATRIGKKARVQEETPFRIEPCFLDVVSTDLADVVGDVVSASAALGNRLHPRTARSLADLVRVMNCYYSNLIEGHNTRPRDIERALEDELEANEARRDLQLEARAHIRVQQAIDEDFASGKLAEPASRDFVRRLHREFYADAPERMLRVEHEHGAFRMTAGQFRRTAREDNVVGRHQPPSSAAVPAFMEYFEQRYRFEPLGTATRILAIASAHHRLNYIHPFSDGNGRVSRLMSHAMALRARIGAHGLWSISRGLARGIDDAGAYKQMMDLADSPRRGDLDGRGNLSREALVEFTMWFCRVMLDQLRFMTSLFEIGMLRERLELYVRRELRGSPASTALAVEALSRGEIQRGEVARITGQPDRTAREVLRRLIDAGLFASDTPKGPVSLRFSAASADTLFPRLFPAQL
jgi:Fic family protein